MKALSKKSFFLCLAIAVFSFLIITAWSGQGFSQAVVTGEESTSETSPTEIATPAQSDSESATSQEQDIFSRLQVECVLSASVDEKGIFNCQNKEEDGYRSIGDTVRLRIKGLTETPNQAIFLYINGRQIPGNRGVFENNEIMRFNLNITTESQAVWKDILGSPREIRRSLTLGAGTETRELLRISNGNNHSIGLELLRARTAYIMGMLLASIAFIVLAAKTPILRESSSLSAIDEDDTGLRSRTGNNQLPYSLGRTQVAFWFFIIMGSFIFIGSIMKNYNNIITPQSLTLIGISATTALSSVTIGNSRTAQMEVLRNQVTDEVNDLELNLETKIGEVKTLKQVTASAIDSGDVQAIMALVKAEAEKTSLEKNVNHAKERERKISSQLGTPSSNGFLIDLLNDFDGMSFHRLQIVLWTLVLGVIFISEVWKNLTMPAFDSNLLALQGISSATYLGFKLPERNS